MAALLTVVVVIRLLVIADNRSTFVRLHHWIGEVLASPEAAGANRLFIPSADAPADTLLMEWGVPFTTMHLTAAADPGAARTILVLPGPERYDSLMLRSDQFLSPFRPFPDSILNPAYYRMAPGPYRTLHRATK